MAQALNVELIRKYAAPVPRYTSYPTAPHFTPSVGAETYAQWLRELPDNSDISLYVHIPFCQALCWYCGCNTKATRRYEPVAGYLAALNAEIARVSQIVTGKHRIAHMHWGGGSPSLLRASDILSLGETLRQSFHIDAGTEFAVEVDPRDCTDERLDALHAAGVNRVSLGVQDFDELVQEAIGRKQSFEDTRRVIQGLRAHGIASVNVDLIYGLPMQTLESVGATVSKLIALDPDRVAIFGYAHLPQRLRHQRLIDTSTLPDAVARFKQAELMSQRLEDAGYVRIGLDHYAKPSDPLASGSISRNFQGYTSDGADILIGLGASSIGQLPQGFVQNVVSAADYGRRIAAGGLATARGRALTDEDRARGWVIKELMCSLSFSSSALRSRFPKEAPALVETAGSIVRHDPDAIVEATADGFVVPERGRPFLRSICARFDAYLATSQATHSAGV